MSDTIQLRLTEAKKTQFAGKKLAESVYGTPLTVLLHGDLGSGKTTFLQGLGSGLGIKGLLTSPTYSLENRHQTASHGELMHIDLYRLSPKNAAELLQNTEDFEGIRCIEWANRTDHPSDEDVISVHLSEDSKSGRLLQVSFDDIAIPTEEQIAEWRKEVQAAPNTIEHCEAVAKAAMGFADTLIERGFPIRKSALKKAAQVHDLLRFVDFDPKQDHLHGERTQEQEQFWDTIRRQFEGQSHEQACANFLKEKGFPALAEMVRTHGITIDPSERILTEQKLLYYADKRIKFTEPVSLDERFADFVERYANGEETELGKKWLAEAKALEKELFKVVPFA